MTSLIMLWAVVIKELRQTLADKRMMALLLAAPAIQLLIFGFAVNLGVDRVPTVVIDRDHSELSRTYTAGIFADPTLTMVGRSQSVEEAGRLLEIGEASVVLILPHGMQRDLIRGQSTEVQLLVDGTDPNRANVAAAAAAGYFASQAPGLVEVKMRRMALMAQLSGNQSAPSNADGASGAASVPVSLMQSLPPSVDLRPRVFFNPRLQTAIYMVPGVAAILLLLITTIITAMGLAREKEAGTMEQILVTPVPSWVLILGKILPFAIFGLFDFALAIVVGAYVFEMPIVGSPPVLLLGTVLYLLVTLGMGLLIATLSGSQQQAFMGGLLFMLPAALLSGIMTPIRSMPDWMQALTLVNPVRHYAEVLRGVLLRGATFADLHQQLLALAISGVLIFTFSTLRFSKTVG